MSDEETKQPIDDVGTDYTATLASWHKIEPQRDDEIGSAFRSRVAGVLRGRGHVIEAHEAYQNARYDQSDDVMSGLMGVVAQALTGGDRSPNNPERQIGDDIASGIIARSPKEDNDGMAALLMMMMGSR